MVGKEDRRGRETETSDSARSGIDSMECWSYTKQYREMDEDPCYI